MSTTAIHSPASARAWRSEVEVDVSRRSAGSRLSGLSWSPAPFGRRSDHDAGDSHLQSSEVRLKALLVSGLAGSASDYRTFLAELTRHLRGYLRKRIPHFHEDVEDLVQEILLAVHNARHTYRPDEPLTAWIHAIARYKLMDFFRTRARRESLHDPLDDHEALLAEADDEPQDARRDIGALLDHLPDKQRLSIVHVKLQGLSVAEAARLTGLSESAVKVSIHRGLKALAARVRGVA
jgi:RNA polymerase sigma-70 factor, ECF subfamily